MRTIKVKAAPIAGDPALAGKRRVCKEQSAQRYITEETAVEVQETAFYLRKIANGELIVVDDEPKRKAEVKK